MPVPYSPPSESLEHPLAIPPAGVFDMPNVTLCINSEWASILDGLVGQLLCRNVWGGSVTEVDNVLQQVHLLLVALGTNGGCSP